MNFRKTGTFLLFQNSRTFFPYQRADARRSQDGLRIHHDLDRDEPEFSRVFDLPFLLLLDSKQRVVTAVCLIGPLLTKKNTK